MAIAGKVPGLEVCVCVDGIPLQEYDDDEEVTPPVPSAVTQHQAARTISKYIEATSDKEFSIKLTLGVDFNMNSPTISAPIYIDGKWAREPLFQRSSNVVRFQGNRPVTPWLKMIDGVHAAAPGMNDQQFVKNFKFSRIDTTTDDSRLKTIKQDSEAVGKVGQIEVKLYRCSEGIADAMPIIHTDKSASQGVEVHEKALKGEAKSHTVAFGSATKLVANSYFQVDKLDGHEYPIAIFKFKYRSRDALKSLLIIERTPTPEAESESGSPPVDLNNLDAAQKRQLAKLLSDMNRGRGGSGTPRPTIKRERDADTGPSGSRKKRKSRGKVTIDLTEDSDEENAVPLD